MQQMLRLLLGYCALQMTYLTTVASASSYTMHAAYDMRENAKIVFYEKAQRDMYAVLTEQTETATYDMTLSTFSSGYIVGKLYSDSSDCSGKPDTEYGLQLGKCVALDGSSFLYTCSTDDSTGEVEQLIHVYEGSLECEGTASSGIVDTTNECGMHNDGGSSMATYCTHSTEPWISAGGVYGTIGYSDLSECELGDEQHAYDYTATLLGHCIRLSNGASGRFKRCNEKSVVIDYYSDAPDCSGAESTYTEDQESCAFLDDDYYGYGVVEAYTNYCVSDHVDDQNLCFPGDSLVLLESGEPQEISAVSIGDRVLSVDYLGNMAFADVVFVPHSGNNNTATCVTIKTTSGHTIRMTKGHLLPAGSCTAANTSFPFLRADEVYTGICVHTIQGVERVIFVSQSICIGTYTIVTSQPSGMVVVDNVVASSFGVSHLAVNLYYTLHRKTYDILNFFDIDTSMLNSSIIVRTNSFVGNIFLAFVHALY